MTNPIIKLVNAETGEEIEREMNAEELAEHKAIQKYSAERNASLEAKEASRAALLDRLGITADEAKLLLG